MGLLLDSGNISSLENVFFIWRGRPATHYGLQVSNLTPEIEAHP